MFHAEDRIGPYVLIEKLGQGQFGADLAVRVYENGAGRIENCDLTGNTRGAKLIEAGCTTVLIGNKE